MPTSLPLPWEPGGSQLCHKTAESKSLPLPFSRGVYNEELALIRVLRPDHTPESPEEI